MFACCGELVESEAIDALLFRVRAKDRVHVTTGEIFAAFPGFEPSTDELAAIHARVEAAGMQIVDAPAKLAEVLSR